MALKQEAEIDTKWQCTLTNKLLSYTTTCSVFPYSTRNVVCFRTKFEQSWKTCYQASPMNTRFYSVKPVLLYYLVHQSELVQREVRYCNRIFDRFDIFLWLSLIKPSCGACLKSQTPSVKEGMCVSLGVNSPVNWDSISWQRRLLINTTLQSERKCISMEHTNDIGNTPYKCDSIL